LLLLVSPMAFRNRTACHDLLFLGFGLTVPALWILVSATDGTASIVELVDSLLGSNVSRFIVGG
jgi:hypothetical protein